MGVQGDASPDTSVEMYREADVEMLFEISLRVPPTNHRPAADADASNWFQIHVFNVMTGNTGVATALAVHVAPLASLKRTFWVDEPDAPAPTASHRCVCGENATSLMVARLATPELADFVHPDAPLGSVE
jgi:hypothetical protein